MLYEKYESRVRKKLAIINQIIKYRLLIIIISISLFLLFLAYSFIKGSISNITYQETLSYGETFDIKANAILSNVTYEYSDTETDIWTKEKPTLQGKYTVKVTTQKIFGIKQEKFYDFQIIPRNIDIKITSDTIEFGTIPAITTDLVPGDYIDYVDFNYDDIMSIDVNVTPQKIVIKNNKGIDVTSSYNINHDVKNIIFTESKITVKLLDIKKEYDGKALTSSKYVIKEGNIPSNFRVEIIASGSQITVGQSSNSIESIKIFYEKIDVTSKYVIEKEDGILEVEKRKLTIKPETVDKTYDGISLESNRVTIVNNHLILGHEVTIETNGSQKDFGTSINMIDKVTIVDKDNIDVTDNYDITKLVGEIIIKKRLVEITTNSAKKEYDGSIFIDTGYEITKGSLVFDDKLDVYSRVYDFKDVGIMLNDLSFFVENNNVNYEFIITKGNLEIIPRKIIIKPSDKKKEYDGLLLFSRDVEIISDNKTFYNEFIILRSETEIRNVGIKDNIILDHFIYREGIDITSNYEVTYEIGKLEITPRKIVIKPGDKQKEYDGELLISSETEFLLGTSLAENDTLTIQTSKNMLNVGMISDNGITNYSIFRNSELITSNYHVELVDTGILSITKRMITVKPKDEEKIYDGKELTGNTPEVIGKKLVEGHIINIVTSGKVINVFDETTNYILAHDIFLNDNNINDNYDVKYEMGNLTIKPLDVSIKTGTKEKEYDGQSLSYENIEFIDNNILENHSIKILSKTEIIDLGTKENILELSVYLDDINMTDNYKLIYINGTLTITKRNVVAKTFSAEKIYDDTVLYNVGFEFRPDDLVLDHKPIVKYYSSIKNVGVTVNTLEISIFDGNINKDDNYSITYEKGVLEIIKRDIFISTETMSKVYDGTPLVGSDNFRVENLVYNQSIYLRQVTYVTDVTEPIENRMIIDVLSSSINVNDNYNMIYTYGTLEVTKRPIVIKPTTTSKIYNDEPVYSENIVTEIGETKLVSGHIIEIKTEGSKINAGYYSDIIEIIQHKITFGITDVTNNYEVSYLKGDLYIKKRDITIAPDITIVTYNDTEQGSNNVVNVVSLLKEVSGHTIEITTAGKSVDAGIYRDLINIESHRISKNMGQIDVTINYEVEYKKGDLQITERVIQIDLKDSQKIYDDTPLVSNEIALPYNGQLINGHEIRVITNGKQTDVGTSKNQIEITEIIRISDNKNVTSNYNINTSDGNLTVQKKKVLITTGSINLVYNGKYQDHQAFESTEIISPHEIKIIPIEITSLKDVGSTENKFMIKIMDETTDKTSNYEVEYSYGHIIITRRTITIKPESIRKVYDGKDTRITKGLIIKEDASKIGQEINREIIVNVEGTLKYVGILTNLVIENYQILHDNEDVTSNYHVNVSSDTGSITIDKLKYTISVSREEKEYDGIALVGSKYEETLNTGDKIVYETSGYQLEIGNSRQYIISDSVNVFNNLGDNVTENYQLDLTGQGDLVVYNRIIRIKPQDKKTIYNGKKQNIDEIEYLDETSLMTDHRLEYILTDGIKEVGTHGIDISFYKILNSDNNDVTALYQVEINKGTLSISKAELLVVLGSSTVTYTGKFISIDPDSYIIKSGQIINHSYSLKVTHDAIIDAGDTEIRIDMANSAVYDEDNNNVTSNYEINTENSSKIIVRKIKITIESGSSEKTYDGEALINHDFSISGSRLAENHTIKVEITGSITDIGNKENTINKIVIRDKDGNDVTNNYEITEKTGHLVIK